MAINTSRRHFVLGLFAGLSAFLKPRSVASAGSQPGKPKDLRESLAKPYAGQGGETFVLGKTTSYSYDAPLPKGPGSLTTVTTYDAFGRVTVCQSILKRPWP
jgi:hypothetical protein